MNIDKYLQVLAEKKKKMNGDGCQSTIGENVSSAADGIARAFEDKDHVKNTIAIIKSISDGEPVNKDPLTEIPDPEMTLYCIFGEYFDTEEELNNYCQCNGYPLDKTYTLEYLRSVAGQKDVIRETHKSGSSMLFTAVNEDGYGVYNHKRSVYRGEFVWEHISGKISWVYAAFRDRGVIFENDIYAKIDKEKAQLLRMCPMRKIPDREKK